MGEQCGDPSRKLLDMGEQISLLSTYDNSSHPEFKGSKLGRASGCIQLASVLGFTFRIFENNYLPSLSFLITE